MVKLNLYIFDILLSFMRICWLIVTIIYHNWKDDFPVLFLISTLEFQEKKIPYFVPRFHLSGFVLGFIWAEGRTFRLAKFCFLHNLTIFLYVCLDTRELYTRVQRTETMHNLPESPYLQKYGLQIPRQKRENANS